MEAFIKYVTDNASWIFSGVGVLVLGGVGRWLFTRDKGQSQKVQGGTAIQAGRDAKVKIKK